ncbi:fatty-acid amide hydrolase 2-B-like [Calliopsis andreniformis]|uniref:fatty-acid amide hydrolase 2-B-like n=1 Tax=Calliopsis andreniformis TaxID=337506 RepID=UPI003FCDDEED
MILLNFCIVLLHFMHFILRPLYSLIYFRKPQNIPPIKNPLLKLSAVTLAKKIRQGELSSQTVVEAYIERIKEVNPFINAVVEDRFEAAVNEAKLCDQKLKTGDVNVLLLEREKPLYGVPVTIKESCSLKGMSYTGGTLARRGMKASEDGAAVEMLKNAGAIPLCVTNTSELCTAIHTANPLFGKTCNPYDRRKSPGGSSGGEGALLGAGASILGIGSDLIGSVRIPCLFNGVFGHKPTPGIISIKGHFPTSNDPTFQTFLTIGPMARSMDDLCLAMKVLTTNSEKNLRLDDSVNLKKLRVFYLENFDSLFGVRSTTQDIRRKIKEATKYLAENGAHVEQLSQEWVSNMFFILMTLCGGVNLPCLFLNPEHSETKKTAVCEFIKSVFGLSQYTQTLTFVELLKDTHALMSLSSLEHYKNVREDLRQRVNSLLRDDAVIICPTYPEAAPFPQLGLFQYDCSVYSGFANLMQLPSTHVPMGLNDNGLPIGFQVMAASYQDHICLTVAKELEKAYGGWVPPPS